MWELGDSHFSDEQIQAQGGEIKPLKSYNRTHTSERHPWTSSIRNFDGSSSHRIIDFETQVESPVVASKGDTNPSSQDSGTERQRWQLYLLFGQLISFLEVKGAV